MNDEHACGFPAFPPGRGAGRASTRNWWGRAWIQAVEDTALDQRLLRAGRRIARTGQVGAITVSPGRISATVTGTDHVPHRTVVTVPVLGDRDWSRIVERLSRTGRHVAALLAGDLPRDFVDDAAAVEVAVLPGIGDLDSECDCEGWELPCEHAAAVSFQVAWLLDADPFVLLLLRGRAQQVLLDDIDRRVTRRAAGEHLTTRAEVAFARTPMPLPEIPLPDGEPPTPLIVPAAPGVDPETVAAAARSAVRRARELLHPETTPQC